MEVQKHKLMLMGGAAFLAGSLLFTGGTALARHHHQDKQTTQQPAETSSLQRVIDLYRAEQAQNEAKQEQENLAKVREEAQEQPAERTAPVTTVAERQQTQADAGKKVTSIHNVRLMWQEVPGAVSYQVVLLRSAEDTPLNIARTVNQIFTNGVDLDLTSFGSSAGALYWKVAPLDYTGKAIGAFSAPQPVASGTLNPTAPLPTTQFGQMDYAPVYPVYSWVPQAGAKQHQVEIYQSTSAGETLVHTLSAGEYDVYEDAGFTTPGDYFWRVRSVDGNGEPTSDWSERSYFTVTAGPTPVAALGDSITHGGGVMSVPPGYLMYDWETYAAVPVKNIGVSGNTTQEMLDRFERDVLPWSPRVLVIMGGVNDYRAGTNGWTVTRHLKALAEKCNAYGIIPVFLTVTPINPTLMVHRAGIEQPPFDWLVHQRYINDWVMKQPYHIDVSSALADTNGWLRVDYTTDGLHPDYFGKKHIGELVGQYLQEHFSWITDDLTKKPLPDYLS